MRIEMLHRLVDGEIVDPGPLNEVMQHVAAAINGGLGVDNLAKTYRLPLSIIKNWLTPIPFTVILDENMGSSANRRTAQIELPAGGIGGISGSISDTCYFSHCDIVRVEIGDGAAFGFDNGSARPVVTVYINGTAAGNRVWQTTYDIPVPANTYHWGEGQPVRAAAGADTVQSYTNADDLYVRVTAGTGTNLLRVRAWVYFPQAAVAATRSNEINALTRQILPPEWD